MQTYRDVIELWPSRDAFAADIGVSSEAARKMWERDRIAPEYWTATVGAAAARRYRGITTNVLAQIAASRRASQAAAQ